MALLNHRFHHRFHRRFRRGALFAARGDVDMAGHGDFELLLRDLNVIQAQRFELKYFWIQ